MQRFQFGQGIPHHPAAALGKRDQALSQVSEVLLNGEASDGVALAPVAIAKLGTRSVTAKELVLDVDRQIASPAADPNKVLISGHSAINQHHCCGRVPILV